jgi:uncharacterized protein (TIGR00251 family)
MKIELREHVEGILLPVRAQPGARRNAVRGEHNGSLRVSVTQAAEKGKANAALARVLCKELRLRGSQIELLAGETAQNKQFLIRQISLAELTERITSAVMRADGS